MTNKAYPQTNKKKSFASSIKLYASCCYSHFIPVNMDDDKVCYSKYTSIDKNKDIVTT